MTVQPFSVAFLDNLSDDEQRLIGYHRDELVRYTSTNDALVAYYEGSRRLRALGMSIPPSFANVETVLGWPAITIDVLEERLDLEGFDSADDSLGLDEVFAANDLDVEASLGHLDALIHGVAFVVVGSGDDGEADPLITVESPLHMTALYDRRSRRVASAFSQTVEDGRLVGGTLYLPDETVRFEENSSRRLVVVDRDRHNLGRPLVARLVNRPRSGRMTGRSEITRAVRSLTDEAVSTLLGMRTNREFYSAPQRYVLGADESAFQNPDGTSRNGWQTIMGRVWALERDENGEMPQVGQFQPASPAPYLDQVKGLAQLLAAEAGIPTSYLGFHTENPASADAIRQAEARLIKRAERRQRMFGLAWTEAARLALLVRDGEVPPGFNEVRPNWRDPATPTRAAAADEVQKLIASGVLTPDSEVTYERLGFSPSDKRQIQADKRRGRAAAAQATLIGLASGDQPAG